MPEGKGISKCRQKAGTMPDIHDLRFVANQFNRQIGGTIMEERKYTFYDRYQKVKYDNVTAEKLEVLNTSYNKEHYMFHQQHRRNNQGAVQ